MPTASQRKRRAAPKIPLPLPALHPLVVRRIHSVGDAMRGVAVAFRSQPSLWIHTAAALGVVGVGLWLGVSRADWLWLVAAIGLVWMAETFNTALEFLADAVTLERRPAIRNAKDAAAGAVLVATLAAVIIGGLVLAPYLEPHLRGWGQ